MASSVSNEYRPELRINAQMGSSLSPIKENNKKEILEFPDNFLSEEHTIKIECVACQDTCKVIN